MAIKITIHDLKIDEVLNIVSKLRADGLIQGKDFDFAFHQSRWDEMIGEIPKETEFTFYKEQYATIFALKYGS